MSALEARGVGLRIGRATIVDDVDLTIASGELVALVGPNGAGKSSVLHLLAGDRQPTAGEVFIDGRPLRQYRPRELALRRAVLPQQSFLQFAFTTRQVVLMGRGPHIAGRGHESPRDYEVASACMEQTETMPLADRSFPSLSGGEQARVSLARVLAQEAPILLVDEPTASLDVRHQQRVMSVARDLTARGVAVLAVLHDLNLAAAYATRIAIMSRGRIVACDAPSAVLRADLLSEVFEHDVRVVTDPVQQCPLIIPVRESAPRMS